MAEPAEFVPTRRAGSSPNGRDRRFAEQGEYTYGSDYDEVRYINRLETETPPQQEHTRPFVVHRVRARDTRPDGTQDGPPQTVQPVRPIVQANPTQRTITRFREAEARYAQVTAQRRSHDREKLLEGGWLRRHIAHTFRYNDYEQAQREQAESEQARREYRQAMTRYMGVLGLTTDRSVASEKLTYMARFERAVLDRQVALTVSRRGAQGTGQLSWLDQRRTNFANTWLESDRKTKIIKVALPAGILGVGLGVATALLAAPGIVTAGVGVGATLGGRFIGTRIAERVNKYRAATNVGHAQLGERADARLRQLDEYFQNREKNPRQIVIDGRVMPDILANADITTSYERGTQQEIQENARRRRLAAGLGGLAAGGSFALGNLLTHGVQAVQQAQLPRQHVGAGHTTVPSHQTPTQTPGSHPTPTTNPNVPAPHTTVPQPPTNLAHEYPWDAATQYNTAHHLSTSPSQVWDTLQHAATQYNATHGTHLQYVQHGTKFWLQDGTQQLSWNQLADFNKYLWNLAHT